MERQDVILVDEKDNPMGQMEKLEAHQKAVLHRAFSIFIFNSKGDMLLQQRVEDKYHSGGLWSNACCSHPRPGEDLMQAAGRRLKEEMGFDTPLEKIFDFIYRAELENGLTEHEFDHVLAGEYEGAVTFNTSEVKNTVYKDMRDIGQSLQENPGQYTAWFRLIFPRIAIWWNVRYKGKLL